MAYTINPLNYDVKSDSRIVIYNIVEKKVYKIDYIKNGEKLIIKNSEMKSIDNYKFKFQIYKNDKWQDQSQYFKLINKNLLVEYFIDKINLDKEEVFNLINYYSELENLSKYVSLRKIYRRVCEDLWLNHNSSHKNIKEYLQYLENTNFKFTNLWKNLNLYLEYIYRLKIKYKELGIVRSFYDDLKSNSMLSADSILSTFIKSEINKLEGNELQFSYLIKGLYYSILGERNSAAINFQYVQEFKNSYETDFSVGQGSFTYNENLSEFNQKQHDLHYFKEINNNDLLETIIISVDVKYLRMYGFQILSNIIALKNYHFHIHIVGEIMEVTKVVVETEILFKQILTYSQKKSAVIPPTFSYEEVPDYVQNIQTLSACARFIHAADFIKKFNSNLLILDADMFITNDLKNYINGFNEYDIGISISRGITSIMPWRRFMAGNIFIKNNDIGITFMKLAKEYIISNLDKKKSWTLDQNALTFAFDRIINIYPDIKIKNNYKTKGPFSHPPIRNLIEKG